VLAAEVAVLAAAAYPGPSWVRTGVVAAAGAVLLATFGRSGGRWWYQAVGQRRRFARRRRSAATSVVDTTVSHGIGTTAGGPAVGWLRSIAPGLRVSTVTVRGVQLGVAVDECAGGGWYAAVAVGAVDDLSGVGTPVPPVAELSALLTADPGPLVSSVQVVVQTVRPTDPGPAGASYRELPGADSVVARRTVHVAVRLAAADAVAVEARGGLSAVETAVGTAALRVAKILRGYGYAARALDPAALTGALLDLGTLDAAPQEHWHVWSSGTLARTSHAVTRWPTGAPVDALLASAGGVSTVAVTLTAPSTPDGTVERTAMLAVAAEPAALAAVNREAVTAAGRLGFRLQRLDGEQAFGAYACLPTGVSAGTLTRRAAPVGPIPAAAAVGSTGLLLGRDAEGVPVALRLFRPVATRVTAVGGWWLPRLLAFRALGTGARVVVRTPAPDRWTGLGEPGRYFVGAADRAVTMAGTAHSPVLLIDDVGADPLPPAAWQTALTVRPTLEPEDRASLVAADALLLQRLDPGEAAVAGGMLDLTDETTRLVQAMAEDMVAVVGGGADRYVWTAPTGVELSLLGAARRG
jgi:type VII secretion protein EccE